MGFQDRQTAWDDALAYRALVAEARDYAIFGLDPGGRITTWNQGCLHVLGYGRDDFIGMDSALLFTPEDRAAGVPEGVLRRAAESGRADNRRWMLSARGRFYSIGLTAAVRDGGGALLGYAKIMRDHTELMVVQGALRRRERLYRRLFGAIDEGLCIIEMIRDAAGRATDCRFLEVNAAFERHTGLRDARGRTARELAPGLDPRWFEVFGEVARTGEGRRFEAPEPALGRWFDVYAFPVDDPRHGPGAAGGAQPGEGEAQRRCVAVLFADVSERRRALDARQRANDNLARFASTAAHDLKEPIRGIATIARFIAEDEPVASQTTRQRLERIESLGVDLLGRITALLESSHSGSSAAATADLGDAARQAADELAEYIRERGAVVLIAPGLPCVRGDRALFSRLFSNLISNAVRYNDSTQKRVEIGREGDEVFVRDNGIGFDPARPVSRGGSSLGLGIVRRIAEGHGGSVRIDTAPGRGTTVYLRFPWIDPAPPPG